MHKLLLNREIYEEVVQGHLPEARQFIWIVTADIKDMHVEALGGYVPLLELLADLPLGICFEGHQHQARGVPVEPMNDPRRRKGPLHPAGEAVL